LAEKLNVAYFAYVCLQRDSLAFLGSAHYSEDVLLKEEGYLHNRKEVEVFLHFVVDTGRSWKVTNPFDSFPSFLPLKDLIERNTKDRMLVDANYT
jgi:hypothetical protein